MKKNKFKEFANKKGFMVAVYSCAAVVIAMTGIIASNKEKTELPKNDGEKSAQVEQANQSDVKSYRENQITGNSALTQKNDELIVKKEEKNTEKATESKSSKDDKKEKNNVKSNTNTDKPEQPTENNKTSKNQFAFFDDSQEMSWPLSGQIVLDYSMETAVYDKTLDQYRTNNSLCISGNVGDDVLASADGKIKSVSKDKENLTSIVIEHGNGWVSTYSQLQDNVLVKEGDIVDEGAVIGNISEPSYRSTLLGPHLEFKLTHNDDYMDPKLLLAQEE